jgi:hypothetical protein
LNKKIGAKSPNIRDVIFYVSDILDEKEINRITVEQD